MSVHVRDGLAAAWPGVEYDPVPVGDALTDGHLVSVPDQICQQLAARCGQLGKVGEVGAWDHQDVRGGLRLDVTEGQGPVGSGHDRGGHVPSRDGAEQAVRHDQDLNVCAARRGPPTYMVALLRTHGAPPLWCLGASFLLASVAQGAYARARCGRNEAWGECDR